jgi:hypothetical protein
MLGTQMPLALVVDLGRLVPEAPSPARSARLPGLASTSLAAVDAERGASLGGVGIGQGRAGRWTP